MRDGPAVDVRLLIRARVDSVLDTIADPLVGVYADSVTGVATDVGVDMLTDTRANVVAAVMTGLEVIMPASLGN